MNTTIGERICNQRKSRGLTQEQLGGQLGVSGQAVSKWEKGESLPDILLLPDLCSALGFSVDTLLGTRAELQGENLLQAFVLYARENGRAAVMLDAFSRLFCKNSKKIDHGAIDFSPEQLLVYDGKSMGFAAQGEQFVEQIFVQAPENIAFFLRILTDETALKVIQTLTMDHAVTTEEVCQIVGIDQATADRIMLGLMKRNVAVCTRDRTGKHGYLQSSGMAGVYLVLAGCATAGCGIEDSGFAGELWFTRSEKG